MKIDSTIINIPAKNPALKRWSVTNKGLAQSIRTYAGTLSGYLWDGIWSDGFEGAISETKLIHHHLYVLGNADIRIHNDDWFKDIDGIWKRKNALFYSLPKDARKIMATTDPALGIPLLTNQFLEEYFTRIQRRKPVENILLDVEYWDEDFVAGLLHCDAANNIGYATLEFK